VWAKAGAVSARPMTAALAMIRVGLFMIPASLS
jgi:hypothetical protein